MTARDAEILLESERQATLLRLAALERDFAGIVESAGQANTDDEHDPEGATLAFERQHVAALLSQARDYLREVDAAKSRLAAGRYGLCEHCGKPVPAARLAARPTATTCVTCAGRRRRLCRAGRPVITSAGRLLAGCLLTGRLLAGRLLAVSLLTGQLPTVRARGGGDPDRQPQGA